MSLEADELRLVAASSALQAGSFDFGEYAFSQYRGIKNAPKISRAIRDIYTIASPAQQQLWP